MFGWEGGTLGVRMREVVNHRPLQVGRSVLHLIMSDGLNGRGDHVCIRCGTVLGATVQSECLEMETC
jgi:hypothetical protein